MTPCPSHLVPRSRGMACACGSNGVWMLILAYLLFGGTLFPMPVIQ